MTLLTETSSRQPELATGHEIRRMWRGGADCDFSCEYRKLLQRSGLRPTRQRMVLGCILFAKGNRHLTAEMLHDEALREGIPISLATVYNTLNQFTEAGLLRQIGVDGTKAFFDTNPGNHHHFFLHDVDTLVDIPDSALTVDALPEPPPGYEIARVDVVVRLRRKQTISASAPTEN
jgi:Fur family iron response transcriptional regulator